jgi:hypothetical protein
MKRRIFAGLVGLLLGAAGAWGQGYRLEPGRLVIAGSDWGAWNFPKGSLELNSERIRPIFIRDEVNAALDAPSFVFADGVGGVRNAGTNGAQAARVLDGDENTFWEPAANAPLDQWWVEIDLGRAVWAKKVVVKFAPEGQGDPLLQFKVLTSNGLPAFSQSKALNYLIAGRNEGLNKTQRVFEFDLRPTVAADPGFGGDLVRFVQVVATASDLGQAEEIDQARWEGMPAAERGDVLYFRREASGVLRQVDPEEYLGISDPGQRGPIKYFRREQPRLAEVEVISTGDNISLGALGRGGKIVGYGNLGAETLVVDGDFGTFWSVEVGFSIQGFGGNEDLGTIQDPDRTVFFDLGTWFWVNRTFLVFDPQASGGSFPNYVINLSDGSQAPDGSLVYVPLRARGAGGNEDQSRNIFFQDNPFSLMKARYFQMDYHIVNQSIRSGIREIQLLGRGYLPQVTLTSGLIELGQSPRILSTIAWDADTPPNTKLNIRTRTGNQVAQEIHYFNKSGLEVTEAQYRKLLSFQRGDSLVAVVPGSDWSNWSQFYQEPGAAITSPNPRRYAMIEATLLSDDPDQTVELRSLQIKLENPLANQLVGEVSPRQAQQNGVSEEFTLYLHPTFQGANRGFDQLLVELPPGAEVELKEVAVGRESELEAGGGEVYPLAALGQVPTGVDSLWLRLPRAVNQNAQELVALRFAGTFYLANNTFLASVGMDEEDQVVWQRVDAGDATGLAAGSGMTVQTPFDAGLVGQVGVSSNPFTPNGDGINDAVEFTFPVFKVQGAKILVLEVYELSGHLVQRREEQVEHAAGRQRLGWDGRDLEGQLAPPGVYLCKIGMDVDADNVAQPTVTKVVASVY